jgi:hypothetical protein
MRHWIARSFLLSVAWLGVSTGASSQETCFNPQNSSALPFEVIVQAPPPKAANDPNWRYRPASGASSMDTRALAESQDSSLKKYWFLWANRCHGGEGGGGACGWNPKGNVVHPKLVNSAGQEVRTYFTSFEKANDCTLIQAAWALSASDSEVAALASRSRLRVVARSEGPLNLARGERITDVCLLPEVRLPASTTGIVLDYEVQDRRTPQQSERFLLEFARLVRAKNKQAILYSNPLDAPTQRHTNLTADNLLRIAPAFDAVGVTLWGGNKQNSLRDSANAQLQMLRNIPPSHIMLVFELNKTSMDDARLVHDMVLKERYGGVMLWRNYAEVGGACGTPVNRKLSCLVFGRC